MTTLLRKQTQELLSLIRSWHTTIYKLRGPREKLNSWTSDARNRPDLLQNVPTFCECSYILLQFLFLHQWFSTFSAMYPSRNNSVYQVPL